MYGRYINAELPFLGAFDPSPFIVTSDPFGAIDNKALDLVQDAYQCCAGQLPTPTQVGAIWICNICERVWAVPKKSQSWTLTKFKLVEPPEKAVLALQSYRWWIASIVAGAASVLAMFVSFFIALHSNASIAVYVSFGALAVGLVITGMVGYKWRKLLNQYKLSLSES